jgi:hypothetical protein
MPLRATVFLLPNKKADRVAVAAQVRDVRQNITGSITPIRRWLLCADP